MVLKLASSSFSDPQVPGLAATQAHAFAPVAAADGGRQAQAGVVAALAASRQVDLGPGVPFVFSQLRWVVHRIAVLSADVVELANVPRHERPISRNPAGSPRLLLAGPLAARDGGDR